MKKVLIAVATATSLVLSYMAIGRFFLRHDPWPMLCVLSTMLIVSVCGFLRRDSQVRIEHHK